jgi:broad specificity phosphatase PhoE
MTQKTQMKRNGKWQPGGKRLRVRPSPGRRFMRVVLAAGVAAMLAAEPLAAQPSMVILVRHAEKAATPADDPDLTAAGAQRAADLASALAGAQVGSIVTTQFRRTRATAAPLAQAIGRDPIIVAATPDTPAHAAAVAAAVRARPPGEVVLVVGHSNTIPAIIAALGGPRLPDLCDGQYATLFVVGLTSSGPSRLVRATYGAADAPDSGACSRTMRQP